MGLRNKKMPRTNSENESGLKKRVKKLLADYDWFYWMPPANGFGATGISDIHATWNSVFMAIETKLSKGHVSPMQAAFLNSIRATGHFAFVVDEINVVCLATFLQDLGDTTREATFGRKPAPEIGARMLDCIAELTKRIPTETIQQKRDMAHPALYDATVGPGFDPTPEDLELDQEIANDYLTKDD